MNTFSNGAPVWSDEQMNELRQQLEEFKQGQDSYQQLFNDSQRQMFSLRQQLAVSEQARMEADDLVLKQNAQLSAMADGFYQVAEVVKNPSGQIRIVDMEGNAFDLCDNAGLKLYASEPKL